ncbi:MAG TPA: carbohydrate-binding family 6 protein [Lacunisphaera sp.]|nr:carbohydrate-binding family 6 protein [Lacunisphaera sp.]
MRLPLSRLGIAIVWALALFALPVGSQARDVWLDIRGGSESAPATFAADAIEAALKSRGDRVRRGTLKSYPIGSTGISLLLGPELKPEAFDLRRDPRTDIQFIIIRGGGPGGVMYGGLELAEQIRLGGVESVQSMRREPHFAMRGVKFNVPLDVRTPSYTDMSDSAQANIATVWDFEFWRAFLDHLARDRYNYVSLWNLHPFPSLVKVPGYEDIALADVQRSTIKFAEHYSTRAEDIVTPAMLAQVEVVKKLTIDEKIAFWRRVMQYAQDRNIDFYLVTWNTYTYGTGGKHGITDALENPVTVDYFRKSVAALFRAYPLLRGIGITAGENMGAANSSFQAKEDWLFATYGQGVLDVAHEQPGRKIRFIHRQHETKAADIARTFEPLRKDPDIDFVFSFKYAQAHVMSSTRQTFHREFVESLGGMKTLWTLRNDDALMFRWGAPDFVREFINNMPTGETQGVYYGSDMWVWGREFLSTAPTQPRQLEVEKHWLDWLLWGRMSYDPTLANDRIAGLVGDRLPGAPGAEVLATWQHASMIYPLVTGFHWGQYDFQWYVEACLSREQPAQTSSGFHDVNRFISLGVHPGTDNIPIPKYVEAVVTGIAVNGTTPFQVADELAKEAGEAMRGLANLQSSENPELRATLDDIGAMAWLGRYYAAKIRGATELALFRRTGKPGHQSAAVAELTKAAEYWDRYTQAAALIARNPLWTNRVGIVDWNELRGEVARDIAIARAAQPPQP